MAKTSHQIRTDFIEFFKSKDHVFIPSSPVIPHDDPTLLFTNAGMNQFKTIFLGENKRQLRRVANSQKCMRVSGKHNDLEEVGRDHYHHTFFEMLGNWSFGDYYKREAIVWAWELLSEVWGLAKERLYATVFEDDTEAEELWKQCTDIRHQNITRFGAKTNFWEMAETGPCGPCSEIHIDLGEGTCINAGKNSHVCGVNADGCTRFLELWNLVFIQYNRDKNGILSKLPSQHVDTGMGLERVVRVIQRKNSNYDTDLFSPIIRFVEKLSGKSYFPDDKGTPFRVIADHIRSLTFSITDGVFPSNEGRGYVIRRLLRRAYRFGRELGLQGSFLYKIVPVVIDIMSEAFAEIAKRQDYVTEVIRNEEERFAQTLDQGIEKFKEEVEKCRSRAQTKMAAESVFMLYDTYGFPMDLTRLMAEEQGLTIDEKGYETLMEQQKSRGRDSSKKADEMGLTPDGWTELKQCQGTEFVGYDLDNCDVFVCRYKMIASKNDRFEYLIVLDKTPFYAEAGGQVGDKGKLIGPNGKNLLVEDTFKWNETTVHRAVTFTQLSEEDFSRPFTAQIESEDRWAIRRNHSATHLLHAALRSIVGHHVQQAGSRVDGKSLRFDFSHYAALSQEQILEVEKLVNKWILQDYLVATEITTIEQARAKGAIALFGEKYGEEVRVVSMGAISKELCGGTHVKSTGQIGLFHITSESSIAAGVRRIEAICGLNALSCLIEKENILASLSGLLKVNESSLVCRIQELFQTTKDLEEKLLHFSKKQANNIVELLLQQARSSGGVFPWAVKDLGKLDKKEFIGIVDAISDTIFESDNVIVIAACVNSAAQFAACAGSKAIKLHGIHCGELVKKIGDAAGGKGGGTAARAQAGAKNIAAINEALETAAKLLKEKASPA